MRTRAAALTVLLTNAADADWAADQERTKQALVEKQREEAREKLARCKHNWWRRRSRGSLRRAPTPKLRP